MHSSRAELPLENRSAEAVTAAIISLLGETAQKTLTAYSEKAQGAKHVESVYAIIHSPWVRSKTIRAVSRLPQETRIEKGVIDALARQALESDTEYDHNKILEASVIRVELNGYPTRQPVGKNAHLVAVSALLAECEPSIREGVAEVLAKTFACPPPTLRSDTRALLAVMRESTELSGESVIVNMSYEATNIMVIRKGVISETALVDEGSSSIVRKISGEKMPEETLTLIRLLTLDQCEDEACRGIAKAITTIEPGLVKAFGEVFGKLIITRRLPNILVLSAHEDLAPWLSHLFSRIDFAQFTLTTRPFSPTMLTLQALSNLTVFQPGVTPDVGLGVGAALVNMEERAS